MELSREWQPGNLLTGAAIAVTRTIRGNTHAGIAYCEDDEGQSISLMHLAFHCKLEIIKPNKDYLYVQPKLTPEHLELIATRCRKIARNKKNKKSISYAFRYNRSLRFHDDGLFISNDGKGLNCSTFVLAVFGSFGIYLVAEQTWIKRPEDEMVFSNLLDSMNAYIHKNYSTDKKELAKHLAYVQRNAADVTSIRVRPEETAGACLEEKYPVAYQVCAKNGRELIQEYDSRKKDVASKPASNTASADSNPPKTHRKTR